MAILYHDFKKCQIFTNYIFFKYSSNSDNFIFLDKFEIYKGDFIHGKRTKNPTYYEDVVEPIISKEMWEMCIRDSYYGTSKKT